MLRNLIVNASYNSVALSTKVMVLAFFFLKPRRRTARHFIKVEKNKDLDRPHPTPIKVPLTTNYICATSYAGNNPTTPGLGQGGQRPRHQLLEPGSPSRTPKAPLPY